MKGIIIIIGSVYYNFTEMLNTYPKITPTTTKNSLIRIQKLPQQPQKNYPNNHNTFSKSNLRKGIQKLPWQPQKITPTTTNQKKLKKSAGPVESASCPGS